MKRIFRKTTGKTTHRLKDRQNIKAIFKRQSKQLNHYYAHNKAMPEL